MELFQIILRSVLTIGLTSRQRKFTRKITVNPRLSATIGPAKIMADK